MIQDIAPHRYDNTYHIQKPGAQDYVFCIQKGRILLRETAEEHVLTIPRREEIEAAVPELMDRAVYLFSVDEKLYFLVSVPEKEAEEILAKLKEGAGQMPVSDKNNMEAGKTDSGTLEGAEKELEQLYYAWKTPTDIRAMEPMHQAFAAITAVQLWRWRTEPSVLRALWGKDGGQQDRAGARLPGLRPDGISKDLPGSHRGDHERGQTSYVALPRQPQYLPWICADRWICRDRGDI